MFPKMISSNFITDLVYTLLLFFINKLFSDYLFHVREFR
jgi:hypothetical protein